MIFCVEGILYFFVLNCAIADVELQIQEESVLNVGFLKKVLGRCIAKAIT